MVRPCVASGFVELAVSGLASMTINQVPVVHLVQGHPAAMPLISRSIPGTATVSRRMNRNVKIPSRTALPVELDDSSATIRQAGKLFDQ
jgi:hypothetical protein